jgi:ribosomal protein S18 acetylase RimI-like enzyme
MNIMDNIQIRRLKNNDISQLALLFKDFRNEESNLQKMVKKFDLLIENENYIFLCAVCESKLCGHVMGIICNSLYGNCDPFLVIEDMIVDKQFRRKGIGKKLMNELDTIAKLNGCNQIILVTGEDRLEAHKFYEKLGFEAGKHKGYKKKLK